MSIYVGVDGGGTKTQVFVVDIEHEKGVSCVGDASNPNSVGWEAAVSTVEQLIVNGVQGLGATLKDVRGVSLCMSGIDRPEQIKAMHDEMRPRFPNATVEVVNDALAALSAGTLGESGVVLIAGTGSIAVGESKSGNVARSGGYGYLIGDEGSGFSVGRAGIMAAIQSAEGRGDKTLLEEKVLQFFQLNQMSQLIPAIYGSAHPVGTVASFAKEVVAAAETDNVAQQILAEALHHYIGLIQSVQRQLDGNLSNQVILSGGLFTQSDLLTSALRERLPDIRFTPLEVSAAAGAALRALTLETKSETSQGSLSPDILAAWQNVVARERSQRG